VLESSVAGWPVAERAYAPVRYFGVTSRARPWAKGSSRAARAFRRSQPIPAHCPGMRAV